MVESLRSLLAIGNHRFLPDRISLLDSALIAADALLSSSQITDSYLAALAADAGAQLATFDGHITTTAVLAAGPDRVLVIPR